MLLQASVFEWKIIHLEGQCLGKEGQPALSDLEISYTMKCFAEKVQFVRERRG